MTHDVFFPPPFVSISKKKKVAHPPQQKKDFSPPSRPSTTQRRMRTQQIEQPNDSSPLSFSLLSMTKGFNEVDDRVKELGSIDAATIAWEVVGIDDDELRCA